MKREATILRLNRMLNESNIEINEATRMAVKADFEHVAREYFDTDEITLNMKKGKLGMEVSVVFHASRIKNFNTLK